MWLFVLGYLISFSSSVRASHSSTCNSDLVGGQLSEDFLRREESLRQNDCRLRKLASTGEKEDTKFCGPVVASNTLSGLLKIQLSEELVRFLENRPDILNPILESGLPTPMLFVNFLKEFSTQIEFASSLQVREIAVKDIEAWVGSDDSRRAFILVGRYKPDGSALELGGLHWMGLLPGNPEQSRLLTDPYPNDRHIFRARFGRGDAPNNETLRLVFEDPSPDPGMIHLGVGAVGVELVTTPKL